MDASILKYLRANGEQLDADISRALDIPMPQLQTLVEKLSVSGDVICCKGVMPLYRWKKNRRNELPAFL